MKTKLSGSMTALATPFRNGVLDEHAYEWLVNEQVTQGTSVLVPMGSTGEAATMAPAERLHAIKVCVKAAAGRVMVFAGAGSNNTSDAIESMRQAREAGADGALVVTPYYNRPTQAGLVEHYRMLARAHPGFRMMAYNVPGRTGCDLLPETAKRLTEIEEIVALKEATGSVLRCLDVFEQCGDRLTLLSGEDLIVAPFCFSGGRGVVSVSSNLVPRMMHDLVQAALAGEHAKALALQLKLQPLHRALACESNPIPVKMALHLMGRFANEVRPPLFPMTGENGVRLKSAMTALGLLPAST